MIPDNGVVSFHPSFATGVVLLSSPPHFLSCCKPCRSIHLFLSHSVHFVALHSPHCLFVPAGHLPTYIPRYGVRPSPAWLQLCQVEVKAASQIGFTSNELHFTPLPFTTFFRHSLIHSIPFAAPQQHILSIPLRCLVPPANAPFYPPSWVAFPLLSFVMGVRQAHALCSFAW